MADVITTNQLGGLSGGALTAVIVISVAVFVIMLIAYTNVISRAGYSRWWILIMLVPLANIVMLLVFCFKEWPVQRELRELRARAGGGGGYGQQGYPQQY
jgi:hypothetical protein